MKNLPSWDLNNFYSSLNDPQISLDKTKLEKDILIFNKRYKNKIKNCNAKLLLDALNEYEKIQKLSFKIGAFPSLLHDLDSTNHIVSSNLQLISEFLTKLQNQLTWFSIEILNISNLNFDKLISDKLLINHKHYLKEKRKYKKHKLSEKEEILINKKDLSGSDAFVKFYDKKSSTEEFFLEINGKKKKLLFSQIAQIAKDNPNESLRKSATEEISRVFNQSKNFYAFVLNNLILDYQTELEIRKYKSPIEPVLLNYEIDKKTLDSLFEISKQNYKLTEKYYLLKSKILNKKLFEWDRYSSIYPKNKLPDFDFADAKNKILEVTKSLDQEFFEITNEMFNKNWIDASPKKGKQNGAYCMGAIPDYNTLILLNYENSFSDMSTLFHEMGHAIHHTLSNQNNNIYQSSPSTAVSEIASLLMENILFEEIYKNTSDKKLKINLLAEKIQDSMASIMRQIAFFEFEQKAFDLRSIKGEISADDFSELYQKTLQPMFGKGLKLTNNHKIMWAYILHFYHYNFYTFTYAFGELLNYSLLQNYKNNKHGFIKNYKTALKMGGSASPREIIIKMGIDINNSKTWQNGFDYLNNLILEFEELTSKI